MIKDAPQRIFLQMGFDENEEFPETVTFDELEGVTWSDDRLNDTDLEYIRIEEYNSVRRALRSLVLSVTAHPDYTGEGNDEWTDLVAVAYRALGKKEGKL